MATAEFAPTDATESDSQALGVGVATPEKALSDAESDSPALSVDVVTPEVTLSGAAAPRRALAKRQNILTMFKALPGYVEAKKYSSLPDLSNSPPDLPDLLPRTPNPDQSKRSWEREARMAPRCAGLGRVAGSKQDLYDLQEGGEQDHAPLSQLAQLFGQTSCGPQGKTRRQKKPTLSCQSWRKCHSWRTCQS